MFPIFYNNFSVFVNNYFCHFQFIQFQAFILYKSNLRNYLIYSIFLDFSFTFNNMNMNRLMVITVKHISNQKI